MPLTYRKAASSETRRVGDGELELTDVVVSRGEGRRAERVTLRIAPETGEVMWKDVGQLEYVRITAEEARAQQR